MNKWKEELADFFVALTRLVEALTELVEEERDK